VVQQRGARAGIKDVSHGHVGAQPAHLPPALEQADVAMYYSDAVREAVGGHHLRISWGCCALLRYCSLLLLVS